MSISDVSHNAQANFQNISFKIFAEKFLSEPDT